MFKKINFKVVYTILSALIILSGTYLAIQYAKGSYRFTKQGVLSESGLLSANSFPNGAQVFLNDKLLTATDDTVYLQPGEYQIKIVKEGYSSWEKQLKIEKSLVAQTNALLFPASPSLTALTLSGVQNISPSPDGQKILYYSASASAKTKHGLYILELGNNLISLQRDPKLIAEDIKTLNLDQAHFIWSPDSSEVIIQTQNKDMLLSIDKKSNLNQISNIRRQKEEILSVWEEEMYLRERQFLGKFPEEIIQIATQSAKNVYLSPDKKRLFYTATQSAVIPDTIVPPLPASNNQPEERNLEPASIYVYDREEDKNFRIGKEVGEEPSAYKSLLANDLFSKTPKTLEASPDAFLSLQATEAAQITKKFNIYHSSLYINTLQWFPDSRHLLFVKNGEIQIMEYDGSNNTTIYAGPFVDNFVYPWPDGSKVIILTSFSPGAPKNLYAIELK